MSLHPNPDQLFSHGEVPHAGHRVIAAAITTLPAAVLLSTALWTLAETCASGAAFGYTALMIFAGFLPFNLTMQFMRGTGMAARMRFGQASIMSGLFALFVMFGPGPVFLGAPCGTGPSVLQSGLLAMAVCWASWCVMRAVNNVPAH